MRKYSHASRKRLPYVPPDRREGRSGNRQHLLSQLPVCFATGQRRRGGNSLSHTRARPFPKTWHKKRRLPPLSPRSCIRHRSLDPFACAGSRCKIVMGFLPPPLLHCMEENAAAVVGATGENACKVHLREFAEFANSRQTKSSSNVPRTQRSTSEMLPLNYSNEFRPPANSLLQRKRIDFSTKRQIFSPRFAQRLSFN